MNRRQWIGSSLAAAALLAAVGTAYEFQRDPAIPDPYRFRTLDEEERGILAAIVPVMLAGALPPGEDGVRAVVEGFDTAVAGLTPSVQGEVAQLFVLLRVAPLRMLATGVTKPWHLASAKQIEAFLDRWRYSGFTNLRSAYDALHQLCNGAWYGNPQSWPRIGYPGPPKVG